MSAVGAVADRSERPAIVRFERVAIEDKAETVLRGRFVAKDVDYALITPPYSKDVIRMKVPTWLEMLERDKQAGRIPEQWVENYRLSYQRWQNGQEMPPDGTPIRGWPVLSPAQQETLIRMNIVTVEDLAGVNDEGARRIGMGALEMKNRAIAWLRSADDKGSVTIENAALKTENANLRAEVETLRAQVAALKAGAATASTVTASTATAFPNENSLTADDILPEVEAATTKRKR